MGSPVVSKRQQPRARPNRQRVPADYLQLAAVRRSTARLRSSAGSTSAGDQRSLSVPGCGEGTFAEDNRKRPTELEKVLPADEEKATHQAQDCGCRAVLYLSRQERLDSRWNPRQSSPSSHVLPLWRTNGMDEAWDS